MTAEDYLKTQGMSNVGHYGLLIRDTSKQKMHQIMEDFAKKKNALNETLIYGEIMDRMENGRSYLMQIQANKITVEDTLEAFGFGRNGLA